MKIFSLSPSEYAVPGGVIRSYLEPREVDLVQQTAAEITANKIKSGTTETFVNGNQKRQVFDLIGCAAEYAAAKYFGCYFNNSIVERDPGFDFQLPNGKTIDAKGTTGVAGSCRLRFPAVDHFRADIAILARVNTGVMMVDLIGGISKDKFLRLKKEGHNDYGDYVYVDEADLKPVSFIRNLLNKNGG